MTGNEFKTNILIRLDPHLPLSDNFEELYPQRQNKWWTSQKEHMMVWFADEEHGDKDAKTTWRYLQCPTALIWIIEAVGIDESQCRKACDEAEPFLSGEKYNSNRACGKIREIISFDDVIKCAQELLG